MHQRLFIRSFSYNKPCHFLFNDLYAGNLNVVLHDKKTNTYHDLSQNPTYTFTHNTSNDANRFELIIANASISIDEEPLLDNPVSIYISGDELVIKSEQFTGPAQIDCYDMAGRLLFQRRVDVFAGSEFRLTAPLAKNQINLINVTANGQQYVEKLVK